MKLNPMLTVRKRGRVIFQSIDKNGLLVGTCCSLPLDYVLFTPECTQNRTGSVQTNLFEAGERSPQGDMFLRETYPQTPRKNALRRLLKAPENARFSSLLHKRPHILHLKALRICWTHSNFLQRWRILGNLQDFRCA